MAKKVYNTETEKLLGELSSYSGQCIAPGSVKMLTNDTVDASVTGTYYAVQFITDCAPTTFVGFNTEGTFSGITYKAGTIVYIDVDRLTVGSGESVILYKA